MRYSAKWPEYARQWDAMKINSSRLGEMTRLAQFALDHKPQYVEVEKATGVPWWLVAVLHRRESDADFTTYLGNGDPLNRPTRNVPAGRGPFSSFLAGAIDALKQDGLSSVIDWRLEKALYYCELFNGAGYDMHGVPSPYIWGGTNIQKLGKYVADGKWSSTTMDSQPGCAPILAMIANLDRTVNFVRESSDVTLHPTELAKPPPQPVTPTQTALLDRVIAGMEAKGYRIDKGPGEVNIAYAEGHDRDGKRNDNKPGYWDDVRMVFTYVVGLPALKGAWTATTQPGPYYTERPINSAGAANIFPGQYAAWKVDLHRGQYEALCQRGTLKLTRDKNKDYRREGDAVEVGDYEGINHHHGSNADDVGPHSAGCLVGKMVDGHEEFMAICKSDPRYKADRGFMFTATVLSQNEVPQVTMPVLVATKQTPISPAHPALASASTSWWQSLLRRV